MTGNMTKDVLIAGAGAMGVITGYMLAKAGARVTFLVRPRNIDRLSRPQVLYSYDEGRLLQFSNYSVITSLGEAKCQFDFVVITLDSASLRDVDGIELAKGLGSADCVSDAGVVLGSIGVNLREWFLQVSGLSGEVVTNASMGIQCHDIHDISGWTSLRGLEDAVSGADFAFRHCWDFGFDIDDSAPNVAASFAELYNACGASQCWVSTADEKEAMMMPVFAQMATFEVAGWPRPSELAEDAPVWQSAADASNEILKVIADGQANEHPTITREGIREFWVKWEADMLPLDLQEFNRFHHGGKVNRQDREILQDFVTLGESRGRHMPITRAIVKRLTLRSLRQLHDSV